MFAATLEVAMRPVTGAAMTVTTFVPAVETVNVVATPPVGVMTR